MKSVRGTPKAWFNLKNKQNQKKKKPKRRQFGAYKERDKILLSLGFESYEAYLTSELWKSIRSGRLEEDPYCLICQKQATVVHHTHYTIDVLQAGSYQHLAPLCDKCHREIEFLGTFKRTRYHANRVLFLLIRNSGNQNKAGRAWLKIWKENVIQNKQKSKKSKKHKMENRYFSS